MGLVKSLLNLDDTQLAFKAKSDKDLRRTYWLYQMIDSPLLTKIGPPLITTAFQLGLPVKSLVKNTIFNIFCGGETLPDTARTSSYLFEFNVRTILDYSVEGEKNEKGFDATRDEIIATLVHGGKHEEVAFSACKMTGLADFELMAKIQRGEELTATEKTTFEQARQRLDDICQAAVDNDTPIFIDAEESWIQITIDLLAEEMMQKYNHEKPIVYTTVQLYRHDKLVYFKKLIEQGKTKGYIPGIKVVRGAYLEKENLRANELNYPTPIQPNKASTDRDYDLALELSVDNIDHLAICAGTHNDKSCVHLIQLMDKAGIAPDHPHVLVAQLLGMSDNISFVLAHHKYNVAKYVPYGPVKAVMPYLIRRANENTAIAGQSGREVSLLRKEVQRRKTQS